MRYVLLIFASLLTTGCATNLRSVDQATISGALDNVLCSESQENAGLYTKETLALIAAELDRRGNPDCSPPHRMARAAVAASNDELCMAELLAPIYNPAIGPYTTAEIQRRGLACDPERTKILAQAYAAKQQQEAQAAAARAAEAQARAAQQQAANQALINGLLMLQQAYQPAYTPPPPNPVVTCNSHTMGAFTNTTCQ